MGAKPIAYLWLPYFGATIAQRAGGLSVEKPLVLLDDVGRVLASDAYAARAGVLPGLSEHQAIARCPNAQFHPAARYPLDEAQSALWRQIEHYTGRWQEDGLGNAYLDAEFAGSEAKLLTWCQGLTGAIRQLGWEPLLGATGSKFGAAIAGRTAQEKTVLLVPPAAQRAFLARQAVTFLPLDPDALLQLRHLGIRTLGQFANLPTVGVLARFGVIGRTAQRWAQGLDDRPVIPSWEKPELSTRLEFEPPLAERDRLLAALMQRAEQLLLSLRKEFQVVGRVRLLATRADGRVIAGGHIFPQPTAVLGTVRYGMTAALDRLAWDRQPAAEITLTFSDIRDQPVQQWTLFDAGLWSTEEGVTNQDRAALQTILEQLTARYSADAFRMVTLPNPDHPLPERRVSWRPFGA